MIEVACGSCGNVHRFTEAELGSGERAVTCAHCQGRIALPGRAARSTASMEALGFTDLPAPKRASPLAGVAADEARAAAPAPVLPPKPAGGRPPMPTRSPLAGALGAAAPAASPEGGTRLGRINLEQVPAPSARALEDAELPAPVGATGRRAAATTAASASARAATSTAASAIEDLELDLPAPKRPVGPANTPAQADAGASIDLGAAGVDVGAGKASLSAVPGGASLRGADLDADLPAPLGFFDAAEQAPGSPAAGGFFEPPAQPAEPPTTLGFFDAAELPAPRTAPAQPAEPPTALGFFDAAELPAPRGFFDPPPDATPAAAPGFFDDPPAAVSAATPGFFDDPAPTQSPSGSLDIALPPPIALDLGDLPAEPAAGGPPGGGLDLDDLDGPGGGALELAPASSFIASAARANAGTSPEPAPSGSLEVALPPLELVDDLPPARPGSFDNLELPTLAGPPTGPAAPAPTVLPTPLPARATPASAAAFGGPPAPATLELDTDTDRAGPRPAPRTPAPPLAQAQPAAAAAAGRAPGRRRLALLGGALAVTAAAAGAWWFVGRDGAEEPAPRAGAPRVQREDVQRALAAGDWGRAARDAATVLAATPADREVTALAAQAHLAGWLAEGTGGKERLAAGERLVKQLRDASATGPAAGKAYALLSIATGKDLAGATSALTALAEQAPDDLDVALFLGWAHAETRAWGLARDAFERARANPARAVATTYGLARAELELGNLERARSLFVEVDRLAPQHVGAQIGLAAAMPAAEYGRRETELQAALARKDIAKADRRAVAWAHTLAGDDAYRAGRLPAARDAYRLALEAMADDPAASIGLALVDLAEKNVDGAVKALDLVMARVPGDAAAVLARAEVELARTPPSVDAAAQRLATLDPATLAPPGMRGRYFLLDARRKEAAGRRREAIAAYEQAQGALGEADARPAIGQALLYRAMAADAPDAKARAELTTAEQAVLATLRQRAEADALVAVTLGRGYLAAGAFADAAAWFQQALARRPEDVDLYFQYAEALRKQGRFAEAADTLRTVFEREPGRGDLGVELAATYEAAGKPADAEAIYEKLLAAAGVSVEHRAAAGRYFARVGKLERAVALGEAILAVDARHPAGAYLRAEGLFAAGNLEEARKLYLVASEADPRPQYLLGFARAAEALAKTSPDTRYVDAALRAYAEAAQREPTSLPAQLGRGRMHLARREWPQALEAYQQAQALGGGSPEVALGLGIAYDELERSSKERAEAIAWLSRAVQGAPSPEAWHRLAVLYADSSDARRAATAYANATRLAAEDEVRTGIAPAWLTDAFWRLGQLLDTVGDEAGACAAFDRYLARNPTDAFRVGEVRVARDRLRCG